MPASVLVPLAALGALYGLVAVGQTTAELADLWARIDYGYYNEAPDVVAAARGQLAAAIPDAAGGAADPREAAALYSSAFAAFRWAQLRTADADASDAALERCIADAAGAGDDEGLAAEAAVLTAACSELSARRKPFARPLHERRRDRALDEARRSSPDNPRLKLIEAWIAGAFPEAGRRAQRPGGAARAGRAGADASEGEEVFGRLQDAVDAFDAWRGPRTPAGPEWGEAEALAQLAALYLARGERLHARDLLERSLWRAPGYVYALRLREELAEVR